MIIISRFPFLAYIINLRIGNPLESRLVINMISVSFLNSAVTDNKIDVVSVDGVTDCYLYFYITDESLFPQ